MRRSEWYVVQVETGRERNACQVIQKSAKVKKTEIWTERTSSRNALALRTNTGASNTANG